jgi:protoporphyrinogen oxidase
MKQGRRAVVIGGGYTGMAAAHDLARAGFNVTILEADADVGGLAGTFEILPGKRVERFYHHWFSSDLDILDFIEQLGLGDRIEFKETNTGMFFANSIFRLASPLDLLKFPGIPFLDRIRTGCMALYARRLNNWRPLEDLTAAEWVTKIGGKAAYEVMWKPLLHGKFGDEAPNISAVWFWNKLKLRGSSRSRKGAEQLAYFRGSFGAFTAALKDALTSSGVDVRVNSPVTRILSQSGAVTGVQTPSETIPADLVLATLPLPTFLDLVPELPDAYTSPARQIRFLGNVCLVLRLNRSLSSTYWLNVADPTFPFVGVIEHTNMDAPENYGGERIAYVSKYLPVTDSMFSMGDEELFEYCLPYLNRIFPEFSRDWVNGFHVWRARYSQPVITKRYSHLIPSTRTPISNLWLSTMAQVYPEDRGTNYAIRAGRNVAKEIILENQRHE